MDHSVFAISIAILAAVLCGLHGEETVHSTGLNTVDSNSGNSDHQPQKRSALISPMDEGEDILLDDSGFLESPYLVDDTPKRSSLFRFGKRQGSLFRFGKRGSLLRFGKRQGSLFRFGKRGGALFRFGRSGPMGASLDDDPVEEKRTLFRFGKRSDLGLLRKALAQYEYENSPLYLEGVPSKRQVDSFHWGRDTEDEK